MKCVKILHFYTRNVKFKFFFFFFKGVQNSTLVQIICWGAEIMLIF